MINRVSLAFLLALLLQVIESQTESWNYINGGLDWPSSSNSCGGTSQSPIALDPTKATTTDEFYFDFEFNNRGVNTTIEILPHISFKGEFSYLKFKDVNGTQLEFNGTKMHFHSPGEHYINGRLYDCELHMVHQVKDDFKNLTSFRYAVVAVLFEAKENEESNFIKKLDLNSKNSNRFVDLQRDFWDDFKQLSSFMHYQGSLTTPACDETVYWFVFTSPLPMGIAQLTTMDRYFRGDRSFANGRGNNRLVQKLNGRTVTLYNYQQKVVANLIESAFFRSYLEDLLF